MRMIDNKALIENYLFKNLLSLNLSSDEYVIFGSGVMFALGIRPLDELDDIDILVNKNGWSKVKDLSKVIHDETWHCDHIYLFDEKIEVYNGWGPGRYDPNEIIKNAILIGDIPFASIEDVVRWKKELARNKDYKHVAMIISYLENNPRKISMRLKAAPFRKIKKGIKTIELRLFDEKRQLINIGDKIEFTNKDSGEKVITRVVGLSRFDTFETLLGNLDPIKCGWEKISTPAKMAKDMNQYYDDSKIEKYGVIGIHLELD